MNYGTTFARKSSVSFASAIDKKGRALISAELRKILGLKFGSGICVRANGKSFSTNIDERGRFSFPAQIRKNSEKVSGKIEKISNGRDCVKSSIAACGAAGAGASPARGPIPPLLSFHEELEKERSGRLSEERKNERMFYNKNKKEAIVRKKF